MTKTRKFVFIAHYVEPWNWLLNLRMFGFLHTRPEWRYGLLWLYPICYAMSLFYLIRRKPFQVVDSYHAGDGLHGYTILINNFGWHFENTIVNRLFFIHRHETIRQRILAATLYAQNELKVDVVGLGALTKDETLTEGGKWLTRQTGVTVPVVHGDTCTAWFVIKQLVELYAEAGEGKPIALVGPTSKIGRAVMIYLVERGYTFKAYTSSRRRFFNIQQELSASVRSNMIHAETLRDLYDCRVFVIGKNNPVGRRLLHHIPQGATVLNFAVPDPLDTGSLARRKDISHFDGGLVQTPKNCNMRFTMCLKPHITYACAAGTMVHAQNAWKESEVGEVNMRDLDRIGDECVRLHLTLAPRSSHLKRVSE